MLLKGKKVLLTGGAGFIGSHLADGILAEGAASLAIIDNLSTGNLKNISHLEADCRFSFYQLDIANFDAISSLFEGVDVVFHLAALGSVPRSVENPIPTNVSNTDGFLNVLVAAKNHQVGKVVFASSSSVYGDDNSLTKKEGVTGNPLSPYAVTKLGNELYAKVFSSIYNMSICGLRFFNVFGPRQNPQGPYAAVIPLFIDHLLRDENVKIFGDGTQSRDFTYVANIVNACLLAAQSNQEAGFDVYNVGCGGTTTVTQLFEIVRDITGSKGEADYLPVRKGDIFASSADISKISSVLGYIPRVSIREGLELTVQYYSQK